MSTLPDVGTNERVPFDDVSLYATYPLTVTMLSLSQTLHKGRQLLLPLLCQLHDMVQVFCVLRDIRFMFHYYFHLYEVVLFQFSQFVSI
jgi:hypothetical protein